MKDTSVNVGGVLLPQLLHVMQKTTNSQKQCLDLGVEMSYNEKQTYFVVVIVDAQADLFSQFNRC